MKIKWLSMKAIIISSVLLIALIIIAIVIVIPMLKGHRIDLAGADYQVIDVLFDNSLPRYRITDDYNLYVKYDRSEDWEHLGIMEAYPLTKSELKGYTEYKGWSIADAYILRVEEDYFYLAFKTINGEILLGYGWEDVGERGHDYSDDTGLSWLFRLASD